MTGIVSYGFYLPRYRIKTEEIAHQWGKNPKEIKQSLLIEEKAVSSFDEDSLTMAYEASMMAISNFDDDLSKIQAVFFGSETPVYAVNPTSTILAEFLGIEKNYFALDHQFACKAATGAMISALGLIKSNFSEYALICASDKATAKTHDALEYTAASGAVSLILGKKDVLLEIVDYTSYSSDTPDFWRREGIRFPSHGGRFTGKPSYFTHIIGASKKLLERNKMAARDFNYGVFHMPNGKFPKEVAAVLGFTEGQIKDGLVVTHLGNSYTASALMGLVAILDKAKAGDLIFFASYGSGAGSDAFIFKVTKEIEKKKQNFSKTLENKKHIDYSTYLKFMKII